MGRPANLVVNILGNNSDLQRALSSSGQSVGSFSQAAASAGKAFAAVWTVGAGSILALTASVFKTGAAYNTLNQTAGAAFKTILGSADAANKMMSDIAAFAKTSPFPRQAFIEASQQMLAFGVQSQKVIPYLGAIQDAVAAAGGSSKDLQDIAFVMAQIQSAGKITAQDLMQFGQRGINAAELIGQSMGKTGAQIRDEISNGTLDATAALDALASGMETRFAGAADAVKQTWVGATDRVKGALRDIGAVLNAPFINPTGGGLGVDFANKLADALRAVIPVIQATVDALSQAFGPTIQTISNTFDGLITKFKGLDASAVGNSLAGLLPVLAAITAASAAATGGFFANVPVIGGLLSSLSGPIGIVVAALGALIATSPQLQATFGGAIQQAFQALAPVLPIVAQALQTVAAGLIQVLTAVAPLIPILAGALGGALQVIAPIFAQLASAILPVVASVITALMPVVQALSDAFLALLPVIQPLLDTLLPPLVQILNLVLSAFMPIIPVIVQLMQVVVQIISAALTPFLPILGQLLNALMPIIQPILQIISAVLQLISPILQLISPILQLAAAIAGVLAGAIGTLINGALKLLAPILKGIADAFGWVADAVANVIKWFNSLKIPDWLGSVATAISGGKVASSGARPSGVSFTAPTITYGGLSRSLSPLATRSVANLAAIPAQRPVTVIVQSPFKGDEIARTIRRELVKLDRRERGIVIGSPA